MKIDNITQVCSLLKAYEGKNPAAGLLRPKTVYKEPVFKLTMEPIDSGQALFKGIITDPIEGEGSRYELMLNPWTEAGFFTWDIPTEENRGMGEIKDGFLINFGIQQLYADVSSPYDSEKEGAEYKANDVTSLFMQRIQDASSMFNA